jgi:DNA topoisomerase III
MDLNSLVLEQTRHTQWGAFASTLLPPNGAPTPHNGKDSDEAHPPIHPTKLPDFSSLDPDSVKIYEVHVCACVCVCVCEIVCVCVGS